MKELGALVKKDFVLRFGFLKHPVKAFRNNSLKNQMALYISFAVMVIFWFSFFYTVGLQQIELLLSLGMGEYVLMQGFAMYLIVVIIFSIAPLISQFYFSNDVNIMLHLPISTSQILQSKICSQTLSELFFAILLPLPILIKYGVLAGKGILFYSMSFIGLIAITVVTISVTSLVVVVIMRYINTLPRIKSALQLLGMFGIVLLALLAQFFIQKIAEQSITGNILENITIVLQQITKPTYILFPQVKLLMMAITGGSIGQQLGCFIILMGVTVAVFFLTSHIGAPFLIKGVLENATTSHRKGRKQREQTLKIQSSAMELAKKEVFEIIKIPIYFFNIASIGFLMPIILIVPIAFSSSGEREAMELLLGTISGIEVSSTVELSIWLALGLGITLFLGSIGNTTTTTFSREGSRIWLMQTLPIEERDQVRGRLYCSFGFQILSVAPASILLFIVGKASILSILVYSLGILGSIFFVGNFGLLLDILHPKLHWDNPQEAIKQNINVMIIVFGIMLYILLLVGGIYLLFHGNWIKIEELFYVLIGIVIVQVVVGYVLYRNNQKILKKRLAKF